MTQIVPGVAEVYVIRHNSGDWRILVLKRAAGQKRGGSWETVYGKIDSDERPEKAAARELREETGLEPVALYNLTVNSFFLHQSQTVQMSIAFVAFVDETAEVALSEEHEKFEWLSLDDACARLTWPRNVQNLRDARKLFANGNGGAVEDVMRVT